MMVMLSEVICSWNSECSSHDGVFTSGEHPATPENRTVYSEHSAENNTGGLCCSKTSGVVVWLDAGKAAPSGQIWQYVSQQRIWCPQLTGNNLCFCHWRKQFFFLSWNFYVWFFCDFTAARNWRWQLQPWWRSWKLTSGQNRLWWLSRVQWVEWAKSSSPWRSRPGRSNTAAWCYGSAFSWSMWDHLEPWLAVVFCS